MASALASLASGRPVRSDVAMTGEITLRGKVLPIGGVKEKVLAAHRAELKTIILPKRNEVDLDEVPEEIKKEIKFVFVDNVAEVLETALAAGSRKRARPKTGGNSGNQSRAKRRIKPARASRNAKTPDRRR
jgi:ATP-dependent Lon protease